MNKKEACRGCTSAQSLTKEGALKKIEELEEYIESLEEQKPRLGDLPLGTKIRFDDGAEGLVIHSFRTKNSGDPAYSDKHRTILLTKYTNGEPWMAVGYGCAEVAVEGEFEVIGEYE